MKTPKAKGLDGIRTEEDLINRAKNYKMERIVMGQFGIEQTADCVVAIASLSNAISAALEDGKINISDLPLLLSPAMKMPAAFSGISEVPKELNELDPEEKNQLLVLVSEELDFPEDIEEVVTKALIIISDIKDLVDLISSLKEPGVK